MLCVNRKVIDSEAVQYPALVRRRAVFALGNDDVQATVMLLSFVAAPLAVMVSCVWVYGLPTAPLLGAAPNSRTSA